MNRLAKTHKDREIRRIAKELVTRWKESYVAAYGSNGMAKDLEPVLPAPRKMDCNNDVETADTTTTATRPPQNDSNHEVPGENPDEGQDAEYSSKGGNMTPDHQKMADVASPS